MRVIVLLLILLSLSWAVSFGRSVLEIERVWDITNEGPYNFTGALVVNDSNQQVVSLSTQPEAEIIVDDETIYVQYSGEGDGSIRASALVQVEYETEILSDGPLPSAALPTEGLTAADEGIEVQAAKLAREDSTLRTIRDTVNWVHSNIQYDLDYFERVSPATEVFRDRRGVCVEYSHLLISMFRSLGLESRYVSGYVQAGSWQPHAWVEVGVPGYGWLPVDPTIGQAGVLDNTHLAVQKKQDQSQTYDMLVSDDSTATLSAADSVMPRFVSENPEGISLSIDMDEETLVAEVEVENTKPEYVFGVYSFHTPENYDGEESSVMLLGPRERTLVYHGFNRSLFREGFIYEVLLVASFNDVSEGKIYSIGGEAEGAPDRIPDEYYGLPFVIAILIILAVLTSRR